MWMFNYFSSSPDEGVTLGLMLSGASIMSNSEWFLPSVEFSAVAGRWLSGLVRCVPTFTEERSVWLTYFSTETGDFISGVVCPDLVRDFFL